MHNYVTHVHVEKTVSLVGECTSPLCNIKNGRNNATLLIPILIIRKKEELRCLRISETSFPSIERVTIIHISTYTRIYICKQ